jgi:hypothetical protein
MRAMARQSKTTVTKALPVKSTPAKTTSIRTKQTKARFDANGLASLGLEKLVEILLEESVSNKALKARLQTALAGSAGPEEIARLIDKRLDALEKARTSINSTRARDMAVELSGLLRNIQSELGAADSFAAFERLARLLGLRDSIENRLRADSVRLNKVFLETEAAVAQLSLSLSETAQVNAVPVLEKERQRDRYGERIAFFGDLLCALAAPAAEAWRLLLQKQLKVADPALKASRLLQRLYLQTGNIDELIALEKAKPQNRQDILLMARLLLEAGRTKEALDWIRKPVVGMRVIHVNGIAAAVGSDYQSLDRRMLEADILDAMKQRDAAQALRWTAFLETFDPDILRRYIARLDDFAEFDELDKAFVAVRASKNIHEALMFLVEWPKLDLAAVHVMAHVKKWDGADYHLLVPAADALAETQPVAATLLYRTLLTYILDRGISVAYEHAARYMRALATLSLQLPDKPPFIDHAAYVSDLQNRHPRKYGFWQRVPTSP